MSLLKHMWLHHIQVSLENIISMTDEHSVVYQERTIIVDEVLFTWKRFLVSGQNIKLMQRKNLHTVLDTKHEYITDLIPLAFGEAYTASHETAVLNRLEFWLNNHLKKASPTMNSWSM